MQPPQDPTNPARQSSFSSQPDRSFEPSPLPPDNYPQGEEEYYRSQEKIGKVKSGNAWKVATFGLLILVVILATATTTLFLTRPQLGSTAPGPTATQPIQHPTPTPTSTVVATPTASQATSTQTQTSNNYSAPQPGPGCDTNGGTWTPQGIGNITCGTQVTPAANGTWGYLYLQLPNNQAFATSNKTNVTGTLDNSSECVGLAEQDTNTGFLAAYCADGTWSISSISNKGIITRTLQNSVTSTRRETTISLALNGTTLIFTIDTEAHQLTVPALQPTKVAIAYDINSTCNHCFIPTITTNNFSYITPAS